MSERSDIAWTDATWNAWRGCTEVSEGCARCYARKLVTTRLGGEWGPSGVRVRSKDFDAPLRWNKKPWVCDECGTATTQEDAILTFNGATLCGYCHKCGGHDGSSFHRRRVFSLSLGDWLEGEPKEWKLNVHTSERKPIGGIPVAWLADMLDVIRKCDQLSWILCTKRPENFEPRIREALDTVKAPSPTDFYLWLRTWLKGNPPPNITILASVENQEQADKRIPELLRIPAARRGLSLEPLLGLVDLKLGEVNREVMVHGPACGKPWISWLIIGCEKIGHHGLGRFADGYEAAARSLIAQGCDAGVALFHKQMPIDGRVSADPSEWPEDLRVRQFPEGV